MWLIFGLYLPKVTQEKYKINDSGYQCVNKGGEEKGKSRLTEGRFCRLHILTCFCSNF